MLKYIKNHLVTMDNIEIFPVMSFIIFFSFFVLLGLYVWRMKKSTIEEYKNYPLSDDEMP